MPAADENEILVYPTVPLHPDDYAPALAATPVVARGRDLVLEVVDELRAPAWRRDAALGYRSLQTRSGEAMQIGFNLPISGPVSSPENLVWIAQQGEALGYDYLTLTDHIVLPNLRAPGYPYSESGEFFGEGPEHRHEQLMTAAFIAAKTLSDPPRAGGDGRAPSAGRARCQDAVDNRLPVRRAARRRYRCWLAAGRV